MRIEIVDETTIRVTEWMTATLEIVPLGDEDFGPMQMFVTSLALCTFAVIEAYSRQIEADPSELEMCVTWEYAEKPFRFGAIDMAIRWPGVPEDRVRAVEKAASSCTIHNTLHHPPTVTTRVLRA